MNIQEGYFSSFDRTEIFYRAWTQPKENALILVHGYGDHSGRYAELVRELAVLPTSIFAFDLRGQGKSKGERVHAENFSDYVRDGYAFLDFLNQTGKIKNQKLFLFGHSLGGLIALQMLLRDEKRWQALMLSSPCFQLYGISWSPIARFLVRQLARITPKLRMANLVKPRFLFHDPVRMKEYFRDPLIERRISCHLANLIVQACLLAQQEALKINVPVSIFTSGDDRIVSFPAIVRWYERLQCDLKSIKIYPNLYHEIFNETGARGPVEDLTSFLENLMRPS